MVPRLETVGRASGTGNGLCKGPEARSAGRSVWPGRRSDPPVLSRKLLHALGPGWGGCMGKGRHPQPELLSRGQAVPVCVPQAAIPQPTFPWPTSNSPSGSHLPVLLPQSS